MSRRSHRPLFDSYRCNFRSRKERAVRQHCVCGGCRPIIHILLRLRPVTVEALFPPIHNIQVSLGSVLPALGTLEVGHGGAKMSKQLRASKPARSSEWNDSLPSPVALTSGAMSSCASGPSTSASDGAHIGAQCSTLLPPGDLEHEAIEGPISDRGHPRAQGAVEAQISLGATASKIHWWKAYDQTLRSLSGMSRADSSALSASLREERGIHILSHLRLTHLSKSLLSGCQKGFRWMFCVSNPAWTRSRAASNATSQNPSDGDRSGIHAAHESEPNPSPCLNTARQLSRGSLPQE